MRNAFVLGIALGLGVSAAPGSARADLGPKPQDDFVWVMVKTETGSVPDTEFRAALLIYEPWNMLTSGPASPSVALPGLEKLPLRLPDGTSWVYAPYLWGGEGRKSRVQFSGITQADALSGPVRVAVWLPSTKKLYITEALELKNPVHFLEAEIHADGTGTLRVVNRFVPWNEFQFAWALALTWIVELIVVAIAAAIRSRKLADRIAAQTDVESARDLVRFSMSPAALLLTCFVVNALTLPAVWWATLEGYARLGYGLRAAEVFALAELVAALVEGAAYAICCRLGWGPALRLALIANAASLALGFVS